MPTYAFNSGTAGTAGVACGSTSIITGTMICGTAFPVSSATTTYTARYTHSYVSGWAEPQWQWQIIDASSSTANVYSGQPPALTPEQVKKQQEQGRKDRLKRRMKNLRIRRTAEAMLKTLCTPEQWRMWRLRKAIRHVGKSGIFEINPAWQGELFLLSHEGKAKEKLCIHASHDYPVEDRAATLLLALRADEDDLLKRANRHKFLDKEERRLELGRVRTVDQYQLN